jgi:hypothetical protein
MKSNRALLKVYDMLSTRLVVSHIVGNVSLWMFLQVLWNVCTSTAEAKISSRTVWCVLTASSTTVSVAVTLVTQVGATFLHTVFSCFWSRLNKGCNHMGISHVTF